MRSHWPVSDFGADALTTKHLLSKETPRQERWPGQRGIANLVCCTALCACKWRRQVGNTHQVDPAQTWGHLGLESRDLKLDREPPQRVARSAGRLLAKYWLQQPGCKSRYWAPNGRARELANKHKHLHTQDPGNHLTSSPIKVLQLARDQTNSTVSPNRRLAGAASRESTHAAAAPDCGSEQVVGPLGGGPRVPGISSSRSHLDGENF